MISDDYFKAFVFYIGLALLWQIRGWEKRLSAQIFAIHKFENPGLYLDETPAYWRVIKKQEAQDFREAVFGQIILGALAIGVLLYFHYR